MAKKEILPNDKDALASFILRAGLAVVFLYAAASSVLNPPAWIGFVPSFVKAIIPSNFFLYLHSGGELALALWLLSNKKTFYAALVSAAAMLSIIIFNLTALDIVFRDIAIMLSAAALAVLSYRGK